jgi:hypothetical protein
MSKLPRAYSLVPMHRVVLLLVGALSLQAIPTCAWAQAVPESLRGCTAESDPARRLACYDREMARLSASPARQTAAPASSGHAETGRPLPARPDRNPPRATSNPTGGGTSAPQRSWRSWKIFGGGKSWHLTARVARLERWPDATVLHLDNGQTWQQMGRASGDLSLRVGDRVTIEEHLGSYWLSSRYVSNMQVRLEPQ